LPRAADANIERPMNDQSGLTEHTLAELGVTTPGALARLAEEVRGQFDQAACAVRDEAAFAALRNTWLGRKSGRLAQITEKWLKAAAPELKPSAGQALNALRTHIEAALDRMRAEAEAAKEQQALARDQVDLTLPGAARPIGTRHLITQTIAELEEIFLRLGYAIVSGPEIETPYYNFEALNIPEHHPARDDMDTFYFDAGPNASSLLLRTHTSPMQIRTLEKQPPPVRIIVPGKVYRRDYLDATHSFAFHQVEGLAVDQDITFRDFRGTVDFLVKEFLGSGVRTRLRPSYFPFTEPSAEIDATCIHCRGRGCRTCKQSGWIELFGAGMVDPAVYGFVGYDAKRLSGFAFGLGVERFAMLRYGFEVPALFQNDTRFLRQFP
jgi:phenylalanyl-tRNA synthetase alpha chain